MKEFDNIDINNIAVDSNETVERVKIGIVDDHPLYREIIRLKLGEKFRISFEVSNGKKLIELFNHEHGVEDSVEIILIDINIPEMDGFECVEWLKKNRPEIKIIVLSSDNDGASIKKMHSLGVNCFLSKNKETSKSLKYAVEEVLNEGYYYASYISKIEKDYDEEMSKMKQNVNEPLSDRDLTIIKMLCQDRSGKEMAEELNVTPRTIENIITSLFNRVGVSSRIGLALYAQRNGMLEKK